MTIQPRCSRRSLATSRQHLASAEVSEVTWVAHASSATLAVRGGLSDLNSLPAATEAWLAVWCPSPVGGLGQSE
jgi:hypothetical protein